MRSSFKRILPILLALAMCGCSKSGTSDGAANNFTSRESGSSISNIESDAVNFSASSEESGHDVSRESDSSTDTENNSTSSSASAEENNQDISRESDPSADTETGSTSSSADAEESDQNEEGGDNIEQGLSPKTFPAELEEIPREYFNDAQNRGTLVDLNYSTYESFTYEEKTQELQKRAVVYLPYGYDDGKKYNVFYLMHGGWSNETTTLGTPGNPSSMKNVLDNAIADGKIPPLIMVCPTYNNTSGEDSGNYSLALQLTRNYHNELINDLIPAVEGKYSSYAESTSAEDLKASRDHRGFCGFSMGSVTTWRTFEYCLDYFRYFAPSSGSLTTDGGYMDDIVKNSGHSWNDFFIIAITGTEDFAASAFRQQIENMQNYDSFRYSDTEKDGNLTFRIKEGYSHNGTAAMEYSYNALRWFWNTNP